MNEKRIQCPFCAVFSFGKSAIGAERYRIHLVNAHGWEPWSADVTALKAALSA